MIKAHPSSFRDPRGFIFQQKGVLYRQINQSCRKSYDELMASGLYDELVAKRLLIPHVEVDSPRGGAGAYRVLRPELVPFVSYPCEWSFGQLKKAALATLRVQRIALRHDMVLRDSSAFNVQFIGSRPVFIDTLSFEQYVEGRPWTGYRQFCQHFLAPLFLMAGCDPRLSALSGGWIDGVPLDFARRVSPRKYRWRPGFLTHIYLHSKAQERYREADSMPSKPPALGRGSLVRILDNLRTTIEGLRWNPRGTQWADYYAKNSYSGNAMERKRRFVASAVGEIKPRRTVDLGANTGEFSSIAARAGSYVVAADVDHGAVELCFRRTSAEKDERVLPLVVDLASPTPGFGWMNVERSSFLDRCAGETDLVMALALVHHLAIGNNVPLGGVVELLAGVGKNAVVEFVEKKDSQVRRLLASREDIFEGYSLEGFEKALRGVFRIVDRKRITADGRVMYRLKRS